MTSRIEGNWQNIATIPPRTYTCGHCGDKVSSSQGWTFNFPNISPANFGSVMIRVCPGCNRPTFMEGASFIPGIPFGEAVGKIPSDVEKLYEEARRCTALNAHTAAVLATRKLLMHIAVDRGAKPNENFQYYVEYLAGKGFVPPDGKAWVDHIRSKGNEANHEIKIMTPDDARDLLVFVEMLLKFIYEFPSRVPKPAAPAPSKP